MRIAAFPIGLMLAIGSSAGFAQQAPGAPPEAPSLSPPPALAPPPAVPPLPATGVMSRPGGPPPQDSGDDRAAANTKFVPCGRSARETDGTTTCIGIPERRRARDR